MHTPLLTPMHTPLLTPLLMMMICCFQSKSPQAVQPHVSKCFEGIRRLEFGGDDPKTPDILAMVSAEGEKVPLGKSLKVGCTNTRSPSTSKTWAQHRELLHAATNSCIVQASVAHSDLPARLVLLSRPTEAQHDTLLQSCSQALTVLTSE